MSEEYQKLLNNRQCPLCENILQNSITEQGNIFTFDCEYCGKFQLNRELYDDIFVGDIKFSNTEGKLVSHIIRKIQVNNPHDKYVFLDTEKFKEIIANNSLPTPLEQVDNVIIWLGDNQLNPGDQITIHWGSEGAVIGSEDPSTFLFVLQALTGEGHAEGQLTHGAGNIRLSMAGWERYQELKMGHASGYQAFMAMPFGEEDVNKTFKCFKDAVEQTGFKLIKLNDVQRAGLIDDKLRVEIKKSRFLISDLTHGNQGAYWEAGYAEGLDKPVIYTCEKKYFENKEKDNKKGTHFDTNHHLTVIWDSSNLPKAAEDLKATIRATIPEAKQQDD